jgi:hypothetical protein
MWEETAIDLEVSKSRWMASQPEMLRAGMPDTIIRS